MVIKALHLEAAVSRRGKGVLNGVVCAQILAKKNPKHLDSGPYLRDASGILVVMLLTHELQVSKSLLLQLWEGEKKPLNRHILVRASIRRRTRCNVRVSVREPGAVCVSQ